MGVAQRKRARRTKAADFKRRQGVHKKPIRDFHIMDEVIKETWDVKKTVTQNFQKFGLVAEPNKEVNRKVTNNEAVVETATVEELEKLRKEADSQVSKRKLNEHIPEGEEKYLLALISKHGDNYKAMERDMRLNFKQQSARVLEKKCVRLTEALEKTED